MPLPVLLVDDDADIRTMLTHLLEAAGYRVVAVGDGQQAIDLLEQGVRPCVVLLDLVMPQVSGQDLLKYMHDDPAFRTIPVVVLSGLPRHQINVIADAVLLKPCDPDDIVDHVRRFARA